MAAKKAKSEPGAGDDIPGQLKDIRNMAETLSPAEAKDEADFHHNVELLHGALAKLLLADRDEKITLDADDVHVLAKALDLVTKARRADAELILALQEEAERHASDQAAGAEGEAAKPRGLSAATVAAIREHILGVKTPS